MAGEARSCWLCRAAELRPHCPSPACSWLRCRACGVTFNLHSMTAVDRDWRPVTWPQAST